MSPVVPDPVLVERVESFLAAADVEWERGARDGEFVAVLPGERKLRTVVSLVATGKALSVSAFVIRRPDENHDAFYRHLLRRNLRLPGVAYAVDAAGDVFVTGRVPSEAVDESALDDLFGAVLDATDRPFNELLALGFRSSMQREWDWRVSRGESVRNLEAFRHLLDRDTAGRTADRTGTAAGGEVDGEAGR